MFRGVFGTNWTNNSFGALSPRVGTPTLGNTVYFPGDNQVFSNYTKLAMLALKVCMGMAKINEKLPPVVIELGISVILV